MRLSRDTALLVLLFVGLFIGLSYLTRAEPPPEDKTGSSYNADPQGVKAFYTLMGERLGYNVSRLRRPYDKMPRSTKVLIAVQPNWPPFEMSRQTDSSIGETEETALRQWIANGGVAIFLVRDLSYVPKSLAGPDFRQQRTNLAERDLMKYGPRFSRRLGKGYICVIDSPKIITNRGMRNYKNAVRMVSLVARYASKRDLVLFDEFHHGYGESETAWGLIGASWRLALVVLAAAAAVALYSAGRRFGAVRSAPVQDSRRPSSEFVLAMGRLYRRASATNLAAELLVDSLASEVRSRLGVSHDSPEDTFRDNLESVVGKELAGRIQSALSRAKAGRKLSERELLDLTREVQQIEKSIGLQS